MSHDPIAYTFEADTHCPPCTVARFGTEPGCPWPPEDARDAEGNPIGAIAPWDEWCEPSAPGRQVLACGTCGGIIEEHDHDPEPAGDPEPDPDPLGSIIARELTRDQAYGMLDWYEPTDAARALAWQMALEDIPEWLCDHEAELLPERVASLQAEENHDRSV